MLEEDVTALKKAPHTAVPAPVTHFDNTSKCPDEAQADDGLNVDCDSYGSMETLSDSVSILIDGEKHWVSGVDANTTCADLIVALLQYQHLENTLPPSSHAPQMASKPSSKVTNQISMDKSTTNTKETVEEASAYRRHIRNSQDYVIVKQLRHCQFEEYLDGSTRLLDVMPPRDTLAKKQCELQLRNLGRATPVRAINQGQNHNQQLFSMLSMSTDKDSGMGSPVGSSRSDRFRRRRGKQRTNANAMDLCRVGEQHDNPNAQQKQQQQLQQQQQPELRHFNLNANERLMNIILAQDATINRQICLLNDKEQQILKIEHDKHRLRERELGKNYLLDAYLNAPEMNKGVTDIDDQRPTISNLKTDITSFNMGAGQRPKDHPAPPDEMQIYWLEKVYALNKQLQREEEQLLRLHAKVRKHQVRYAYHTKGEVMQQIDRLDTELAIQVTDIYRVERQLLMANEQLKAKLGVLECLGHEFEVDKCGSDQETIDATYECHINADNMQHLRATIEKPTTGDLQLLQDDIKQIEKNSNVRYLKDCKLVKKQMFGMIEQQQQQQQDRSQIETQLNIEHLGTLV